MFNTLREMHIMKRLDGRKLYSGDIFKGVADKMKQAGCVDESEQVCDCWSCLWLGQNMLINM